MISYDITRKCQQPRWRSVSPGFRIPLTRKDIVADNKREQILYRKKPPSFRKVPAFTIQTEQQNTRPFTPAKRKCRSQSASPSEDERFIRIYDDRRLPIRLIDSSGTGMSRTIEWQLDPNRLSPQNARELLKQFSIGLPTEKQPYRLIAFRAFQDLLTTIHGPQIAAETMIDYIPQIRKGLNSCNFEKRIEMCQILQQISKLNGCGRLLVAFYRQILPPFRKTKTVKATTDISTTLVDKYWSIADKTLSILEENGGPNAGINIKYILPHY